MEVPWHQSDATHCNKQLGVASFATAIDDADATVEAADAGHMLADDAC